MTSSHLIILHNNTLFLCINNLAAHAGSRTRVTSMGGLYDAATLHALKISQFAFAHNLAFKLEKFGALAPVRPKKYEKTE